MQPRTACAGANPEGLIRPARARKRLWINRHAARFQREPGGISFPQAMQENDGEFGQNRLWLIEKCRLRRHMKEKTTRPSSPPFLPSAGPPCPLPHYSEEGMIGTMEGVISQADARAGHGAGNPRSSTETSNKYPARSGKSIQMFQTYSQVVLAARVCQAQMDNAGSLYHQLFGNGYRTGSGRSCTSRSVAYFRK
ncbi:hypothetical protein FEE59_19855 [Herbaspirillum sp. RU 5E]|nr:hypothetical protein [Herbaspirillum sp. RU 5E]